MVAHPVFDFVAVAGGIWELVTTLDTHTTRSTQVGMVMRRSAVLVIFNGFNGFHPMKYQPKEHS